jgi:hypothetical protein
LQWGGRTKNHIIYTQSVPATLYPDVYLSTSVIKIFQTRAVSLTDQTGGGGDENANPGRDGMTTSNDMFRPVGKVVNFVNFSTAGRNSKNEP